MPAEYKKELPPITATNRPFWEGAKEHRLMAYKCLNCGTSYGTAMECTACGHPQMKWVEVSGRGELYTFTVVHRAYHPAWEKDIPYNIAWVKLDEGPILLSSLTGCRNQDLRLGMRVQVVFEDVTPEVTLPRFAAEV
jgi:uncharacterized protein